jgi:hypothetical protein
LSSEDDSIKRLIREAIPNGIVTHYVAVLEVMGEDGQELRLSMSDSMTPWLALGMLQGAARMVDDAQDDAYDMNHEDDQ